MRHFHLIALGAVLWLASCKTQQPVGVNYLENTRDTTITGLVAFKEPVIQKNDLLSITVYSESINPAIDAPYNIPQTASSTGSASTPAGFLVDVNGNITYPRLGVIKAEGLTKTALSELIKSKLQNQLTNPSVTIRFLNYRVTVLGEVRNPGTYTVPVERVTILEALGLAGDITEFGRRNTVKVLRETNGQQQVASINLSSKDMFTSPYFVLQQNDVVFVEQNGERRGQRNQQNVAQQVGIATGIVTTIALLLNFLK